MMMRGARMMILLWTIVLLLKQLWDFIVIALDESEDWDITETLSNLSSCNWQRKKIVNEKKRLVMCTGWTPRRSGCVIILYSLDKAERNYVSEADQITNTTIDTNRVNQSTSSLYFPKILIQYKNKFLLLVWLNIKYMCFQIARMCGPVFTLIARTLYLLINRC